MQAAGRALADVREVFGDVPRGTDADQLVRRARRLVRQAALDEFAREGVTVVTLPEQWGRAELRKADIPGDAAFQSFVGEVMTAIDISPSALDRDAAIELRRARSSRDAYGISLEVASDLASFIVSRAWRVSLAELPPTDAETVAAAGTGAPGAPTEQEYVEQQAAQIREDVRSALERVVRVPLELQVAVDKHRQVEEGVSPDGTGFAGDEADELADTVRETASAGTGRSSGAGWTAATGDAGSTGAKTGRIFPPSSGADGDTGKPKRSLPEQVSAVHDFATSEAGRKTFDVMRTVGVKAFELYQQREEGKGTGASGSTRRPTPPTE